MRLEKLYNVEIVYDDRTDVLEVNRYDNGTHLFDLPRAVELGCPIHPEEDNTNEVVVWLVDLMSKGDHPLEPVGFVPNGDIRQSVAQ